MKTYVYGAVNLKGAPHGRRSSSIYYDSDS